MGENDGGIDKMREEKRIKRICKSLEKLWIKCPDQRLGQLLENYIFTGGNRGTETGFLFFQEDTKTEELLNELLNEIKMSELNQLKKEFK